MCSCFACGLRVVVVSSFENPNSYPKTLKEYTSRIEDFPYSTKTKYDIELKQKIDKHLDSSELDLKMLYENIYSEFKTKSENGYYAESTFRTYRVYLVYGIGLKLNELNNGSINDEDIDAGFDEYFLEELYLRIINTKYTANKDKPKRTSELKTKYFERTFYNYLVREFEHKNESNTRVSEFDRMMVAFVDANLVVGLRPVEWFSVSFCCAVKGPKLIMIVENGKATHGRANGLKRYLILDDLKHEDQEKIYLYWNLLNKYVRKVSSLNKSSGYTFGWDEKQTFIKILQERLRLSYINYFKLRGKVLTNEDQRPTLYSTRHQCIANAKVKGIDKFVIAGAFGHAGKDTASNFYGRKWRGHSGFSIKPTLDSIENVNGSHEFVKTLLANNLDTFYYFDLNIANEFNTDYYKDELKSGLVID